MDAAVSCEHVYRPMAARALRRLAHAAGSDVPDAGRVPGFRGYATAGFVANYSYCASGSGLERGFAAYEDYIFPRLTAFKAASLVDRSVDGIRGVERFLEDRLDIDILKTPVERLYRLVNADRKGAARVNREFLDWLTRRRQPERPFFAFLNYFDAHSPYELPAARVHRFGAQSVDPRDSDMIQDWWPMDKTGDLLAGYRVRPRRLR